MERDSGANQPQRLGLTRRRFMRLAAGMAATVFLPACHRSAAPFPPLPPADAQMDTTLYAKAPPWRLGRSGRGEVNAWMVMFSAHIEYGVRDRFQPYFGDFLCRSANWDPNKQIEDIRILLARGIDLLLIDPIDASVVLGGVEEAMRSGVPVIVAPTRVQSDQFVTWVSNNEESRGEQCAEWISRIVPSGAVLVLQSVPAADDSAAWLSGVRRRLDRRPELDVSVLRCSWQAAEARRLLAARLDRRDAVDGVIVSNGLLGQGVVQAFVERGNRIPPISGGDDSNGWLRTAKEHSVRFLGTGGGASMGLHCVELATRILSGQPVQRHVAFPYQAFEADAVDRYYRAHLSDHYWAFHELPEDWIDRMFRL